MKPVSYTHLDVYKRQLLFGETEEKADLITDYGKDVIQLEQRMAELAAADAARTKKHHERHAAAPEPVSYTHLQPGRRNYFA